MLRITAPQPEQNNVESDPQVEVEGWLKVFCIILVGFNPLITPILLTGSRRTSRSFRGMRTNSETPPIAHCKKRIFSSSCSQCTTRCDGCDSGRRERPTLDAAERAQRASNELVMSARPLTLALGSSDRRGEAYEESQNHRWRRYTTPLR